MTLWEGILPQSVFFEQSIVWVKTYWWSNEALVRELAPVPGRELFVIFSLNFMGVTPMKIDTGDTTFVMIASALVMLMTPGLALLRGDGPPVLRESRVNESSNH